MRIFQVCDDRGIAPGGSKGAAAHLRAVARAFMDTGNDVHLFLRRLEPASEDLKGIPVRPLEATETLTDAAAMLGRPNLIYERYSLGGTKGLEASTLLGCPLVLEVNAPLVAETRHFRPQRLRPEHERIEEHLFRQATWVVTVSEPLRRHVAAIRGGDEGVIVIPNGCDPTLYPRPADPGARAPLRIVFLGNPKPWHGAETLPSLVADLRAEGHAVELLVIGGGPGADHIRACAQDLGVAACVHITGEVSQREAARHLTTATILAAPYPRHEFFYFSPLKIVEAMAAGLPVVTTDQGDLSALLDDCGILVPPDDPVAFRRAVADLLQDPDERARLGHRARMRALAKLSWTQAVWTLMQHVDGVVPQDSDSSPCSEHR